jgi:hypothetical protein
MKFLFFVRDFPLVAFPPRMSRSPCYPDIRYFFFLPLSTLFNFLRETLVGSYERTCELLCVFALLLLNDINRGQIWGRRSQEIFLSLAPCWKSFSLSRRKLSLRNMKILERKCCMIQSIRQLLHRQHLLHLPRDRINIF